MINDIVTLEEHSDTIAILNMQDLVNKNTFTDEFVTKMVEKLRMIHSNTNYKAVIIKGLPEIFSAGASKDALRELAGGKAQVKDFILSELLVEIPVPVIVAMEGGAVGGGLVIGLCCDIVIMNQRCLYGGGFLNTNFRIHQCKQESVVLSDATGSIIESYTYGTDICCLRRSSMA